MCSAHINIVSYTLYLHRCELLSRSRLYSPDWPKFRPYIVIMADDQTGHLFHILLTV
jgi:hypothetical protein